MIDLRRISKRWCWIILLSNAATMGGVCAQKSPPPDIRSLMEQLNNSDVPHSNTLKQIVVLSEKDPSARQFVVQKLPDMIRGPESDVWLDAIRLAEKLKAKEAVPALQEAMSRSPFPAETSITLASTMRLDNDIVARALSRIGDPAIPTVTELLKSGDVRMRYRAALILRNIGSPESRKALRNRLPHETDPEVKKVIQDSLSTVSWQGLSLASPTFVS